MLPKAARTTGLDHIPGDLGLPFLGETLPMAVDPLSVFDRLMSKHGKVYKLRLFGHVFVQVVDPKMNRLALIEQPELFSNEFGWDFAIGDLFQNGVMLQDGQRHKHTRGILQVVFNRSALESYIEHMEPEMDRALASWPVGQSIPAFPRIKEMTLQIAGRVFFGLDLSGEIHALNKAISDIVKAATAVIPLPIPFTPYWQGLRGREFLVDYFGKVIDQKRQSEQQDMFSRLCRAQNENGQTLTDTEIIDQIIFVMMAGHDTTASTASSIIYELGRHTEIQQAVRREAQDFYANGAFGVNRTKELEILGNVIKETLRLHPPLMLIPRRTVSDIDFNGLIIPANTRLALLPYYTHRDASIWSAPDSFDPDRFSSSRNEHKKVPGAYVPFGGGQHQCIGLNFAEQQLKLFISKLVCRFQWEFSANYRCPYRMMPIAEPKDGLPVAMTAVGS